MSLLGVALAGSEPVYQWTDNSINTFNELEARGCVVESTQTWLILFSDRLEIKANYFKQTFNISVCYFIAHSLLYQLCWIKNTQPFACWKNWKVGLLREATVKILNVLLKMNRTIKYFIIVRKLIVSIISKNHRNSTILRMYWIESS